MLRGQVLNFERRTQYNHHPNIPPEFRMLICGKSGSGKTCELFRILATPNFLDYNNLMIFAPTLSLKQQEFQLLYHGLANGLTKETITSMVINQEKLRRDFPGKSIATLCKLMAEIKKETNGITVKMTDKFSEIPDPSSWDRNKKNVLVLEDCKGLKEMYPIIRNHFTRGRISSINVIFLSQGYTSLPLEDIRENANFLILFKHEKRKAGIIYDLIGSDSMSKSQFLTTAANAWTKDNGHGYIYINLVNGKIDDDIFKEVKEEEVKEKEEVEEEEDI